MLSSTRLLIRKGNDARDARDWATARDAYGAALKRNPDKAHIWVQFGHALNEGGRHADALVAYRRAQQILPDVADTHHQIGRMLERLGDDDEALISYDRALALDPALYAAVRESAVLRVRIRRRDIQRPAGLPASLRYVNLGTTGTCNASCVHCPTGKAVTAHVPRGAMPMELFHKIIDGIGDLGLTITGQLAFGLFGDGLVDPLVVQRAEYLRSNLPHARLSVNTNGAAFNKEKHAPLRELASIIALHCESLVPETYNFLMQPLRAERVFPKYEQILETFPGKVVVSVPVTKRNFEELPSIRQWFLERGAIDVVFDPLSSRCADDRSVFDSLALNPKPIRCPSDIMDDLIIDCDGKVLICCQDFERVEGIGNLMTESLPEVLAGVHRINTRKLLAENRHEELATCSRCYADLRGENAVPYGA